MNAVRSAQIFLPRRRSLRKAVLYEGFVGGGRAKMNTDTTALH